jgi:hypothetical protein
MMLFAQVPAMPATPSAPVGGDFWNPANWVDLAREIGLGGLLLIIFFLSFIFLAHRIFAWTIGSHGWLRTLFDRAFVRMEQFTATIEHNSTTTANTLARHMDSCNTYHAPGGPCHVVSLQNAAHAGAEAIRAMSKGTDNETEVGHHVDRIHEVLRGVPLSSAPIQGQT